MEKIEKRKLLRKIIAIAAAVLMIFCQMSASSFADSGSGSGQVRVIVENTTFNSGNAESLGAVWKDTYWTGTLVDKWVDVGSGSTMMAAVVKALDGYEVKGAESNYISKINGLGEFDGGSQSGWMGTVNDWFVNEGLGSISVESGDEIRVMYTVRGYGEDLGSSFSSTDKSVTNVYFSTGTLDKTFSSMEHEYTLTVPEGTTGVVVTPTAANKNFQVRTSVDGVEYKRLATVPVSDGKVITVKCGDKSWPSMSGNDIEPEVYNFTVRVNKTTPDPGTPEDPAAPADPTSPADPAAPTDPSDQSGKDKDNTAVKPDGSSKTSALISAARKLKVKGFSVKSSSRRFVLSWKKNTKASGYQVVYKKAGWKKYRTLKVASKTKIRTKKLVRGKKYSFKVRTWKKVNGKKCYGRWTAPVSRRCR
ncbi:MAG: DUF4430 domain-containing protein [Anaerovoracaceae bacterium]